MDLDWLILLLKSVLVVVMLSTDNPLEEHLVLIPVLERPVPGTATTVGSALVQLGQNFVEGVAPSEIKKYSGDILYIDNRSAIQRSANQKEDIKIVLEF